MTRQNEELAIEFVRTRGWEARDRTDDELEDWGAYVRWAKRAGAIGPAAARQLMRSVGAPAAGRALSRARRFRDSLYRILVGQSTGRSSRGSDLERLSEGVAGAARCRRVVWQEGVHRWAWSRGAQAEPDFILWQVAQSAVSLLTGELAHRIRLCSSHDCGWLFLDESRNRSRRWCSMRGCGNVEKARRFRGRSSGNG